ncbi:MAG: type II secretion system protein GspJ [Kangiella sp.]|nr:MAG: type II secretion system protein GspJ [Kangiella sp.]
MKFYLNQKINLAKTSQHQNGFTLLEILIAMAIAAVIGVAAFTLLDRATLAKTSIENTGNRYNSIERAWLFISDDIQQLAPRKFRDEFGDKKDNLSSDDGLGSPHLNLTRMGRRNPAGLKRSNLERLTYFVKDKILRRVSFSFPDGMILEQGLNRPLLENVESIKFDFYDGENWNDYWPLSIAESNAQDGVNSDSSTIKVLPVAVRVTLELSDLGLVNRLFVLSDPSVLR